MALGSWDSCFLSSILLSQHCYLEQAPQVYGVLSVPCSVSVILAALIFSPILAASLWCGSFLGCLAGKSIQRYLALQYIGNPSLGYQKTKTNGRSSSP